MPPGVLRAATPSVTPVPLPDLAIVNVEAMVAGDKGGILFCNLAILPPGEIMTREHRMTNRGNTVVIHISVRNR